MNNRFILCGALAFGALTSVSFATSASGLSSFEGTEEPTVVYHVSSKSFTNDSYANLTSLSGGFKSLLRYRANNWWDGDRATTNTDRQRGEVKGLGSHQLPGDTFEYTSTWKTNSTFKQNGHFCHIFQLKALDGDNGAPLITQSLDNGGNNGGVQYCSGSQSGFSTARSFTYTAGSSKTVKIRVKVTTSSGTNGLVQASINGDSLQGKTNIGLYRSSSTSYRPKWGLYRGVGTNDSIGDDSVQHTGVSSNKI
jgi:hypothetical protein